CCAPNATIEMARKKRPIVVSLSMTPSSNRLLTRAVLSRNRRGLPFSGEQGFVAPVSFDELSVFLYGVTAPVIEPEAHLTVLIDQFHARLRSVADVTIPESEGRDLARAAMNMIIAAGPLNYGFRAVVTYLKIADDVRRYLACPCRCDKFSELADVRDQMPEQL